MADPNLRGGDPFKPIWDAIYALRNASPLDSASVQRGLLQILNEAGFRVADGASADVEGTLNVQGLLNLIGELILSGILTGSGTGNWTGPWNQVGDFHATGDSKFDGDVEITLTLKVGATMEVTGVATFKNDVNVESPGKVNVGTAMTLDPSISSGAIAFSNGAQVFTDASTIQVYKGNGVAQISDDYARIQYAGSVVQIDTDGAYTNVSFRVEGTFRAEANVDMPDLPPAPPGSVANVWIDPATGRLHQII